MDRSTRYLSTDTVNLSILPGGNRNINGEFQNITWEAWIWGFNNEKTDRINLLIYPWSWDDGLHIQTQNVTRGMSVRLVREATPSEETLSNGTIFSKVQDYNGNYYELVKIGSQIWTAQNIRATNYIDGTSIPNITNDLSWSDLNSGAYCWYDNDINTPGIVFTDEFITI